MSYKYTLHGQVSLSLENKRGLGGTNNRMKSISYFYTPNIIKLNEWAINCWQVNSSSGWYEPGNICSPKNLNVCSTKYCNCLGRSMMLGYNHWNKL